MSQSIDDIGRDWIAERVAGMADSVSRITPVAYNEANRYLPQGVSPRPGFIRYDLFPYLREPLNNFDPFSPVRETNFVKGVQTGYTTLLESVLFYIIGHIKTAPAFYITADKELAKARLDNNIIPMLVESEMRHLIRSADVTNSRKTGQTDGNLQWDGGGYLIYNGANNAAKMRQFSMPYILKDELDGWQALIGKDGNSDGLTDDRASAYWDLRKILRGSTPTEAPSMIHAAFLRGDQRYYRVLCRNCNAPQTLRMDWKDSPGGFLWELDRGQVIPESVRYACKECGHEHYETDKDRLFAEEEGAHWKPTARPVEPNIRSYKLPAFYSPYGFRPWSKNVIDYLEAYDPDAKQVRDSGKLQVFYNNVLAEPFEVLGGKVHFTAVSAHRRAVYRLGQIPNKYAERYSGSPILFLTCFVDVHDSNLAVGVMGWTKDARCYLIDYWRFEQGEGEPKCSDIDSPVWGKLQTLLEETIYTADDGKRYNITMTLVDAGYATDTVVTFCSSYISGVYPSIGRDRPAKFQSIKEFAEYETQQGTKGYRILVDHYKDRLAPVLRREWIEEAGEQKQYHFNAPIDLPDKALKELTVETRRKRTDERGQESHYWYRPGNARNELWDILVGGHASVEILAWAVCIQQFELKTIDWPQFWLYLENSELYFTTET